MIEKDKFGFIDLDWSTKDISFGRRMKGAVASRNGRGQDLDSFWTGHGKLDGKK